MYEHKAIDTVAVQSLLAWFCCVLVKRYFTALFFALNFDCIIKYKLKIYISSYSTDGTEKKYLWGCVSRMPNPSSLLDHGFDF